MNYLHSYAYNEYRILYDLSDHYEDIPLPFNFDIQKLGWNEVIDLYDETLTINHNDNKEEPEEIKKEPQKRKLLKKSPIKTKSKKLKLILKNPNKNRNKKNNNNRNGMKRASKWTKINNYELILAALWEIKYTKNGITIVSKKYNIPIRTLRRRMKIVNKFYLDKNNPPKQFIKMNPQYLAV